MTFTGHWTLVVPDPLPDEDEPDVPDVPNDPVTQEENP